MLQFTRVIYSLFLIATLLFSETTFANEKINIPILCYHNFNPTKKGSMNLTPQKFESQVKWIVDNGYHIVPLKQVVDYLLGKTNALPTKAVVITADDGWKSAYTYMYPVVKKYNIPVTLFIYPQTISEGKNAMTWDDINELRKTGLFDIQGHTYDHPNFKHAKRDYSAATYDKFVTKQLAGSKKILEDKLGIKISYLAWPFGIYNDDLEKQAANAGYEMAFTIDAIPANKSHRAMAEPRYMIVDGLSEKTFHTIVSSANS